MVTQRRRNPTLGLPGTRRMNLYAPGQRRDDPVVCGDPDPSSLIYVQTTGMVWGIRAHTRLWVSGTAVAETVDAGLFVEVDAPPEPVKVDRTPPPPPAQPDAQPKTPSIMCRDCTMTWRAGGRITCTCEPRDEEQWVQLA